MSLAVGVVQADNAGKRCPKGTTSARTLCPPPRPSVPPPQQPPVNTAAAPRPSSNTEPAAPTAVAAAHDSLNVNPIMATLAANDQENAVRHLQAAAAGKSLNAGLKGFNAKTPGNKAPKTPFKIPLNDENAVTKGGKSILHTKGKGAELVTGGKGGKVDDNAFVTPAGTICDRQCMHRD